VTSTNQYVEWHISSWRDAVEVAGHMHGWLFRGQSNNDWNLASSLEREANDHSLPAIALQETEKIIVELFQREAHHHLRETPAKNETLEWLSIMQHHGAPTRLLDATKSFYVAAFFALESMRKVQSTPPTSQSVIWAFDKYQLDRTLVVEGKFTEDVVRERVQEGISEAGECKVVAVRPWRLNQRLILQQGWFLCPLGRDISSFEHCLCKTFGLPGSHLPAKTQFYEKDALIDGFRPPSGCIRLIKFIIPYSERLEALRDLRAMNITAATLFPGLDGFARSLKYPAQVFDGLINDNDA